MEKDHIWSVNKKNKEKRIISKITIADEINVSLFSGQVTFCNSCLTCLTNKAGDIFFFSIFIFIFLLAGVEGFEPSPRVLETHVLTVDTTLLNELQDQQKVYPATIL